MHLLIIGLSLIQTLLVVTARVRPEVISTLIFLSAFLWIVCTAIVLFELDEKNDRKKDGAA